MTAVSVDTSKNDLNANTGSGTTGALSVRNGDIPVGSTVFVVVSSVGVTGTDSITMADSKGNTYVESQSLSFANDEALYLFRGYITTKLVSGTDSWTSTHSATSQTRTVGVLVCSNVENVDHPVDRTINFASSGTGWTVSIASIGYDGIMVGASSWWFNGTDPGAVADSNGGGGTYGLFGSAFSYLNTNSHRGALVLEYALTNTGDTKNFAGTWSKTITGSSLQLMAAFSVTPPPGIAKIDTSKFPKRYLRSKPSAIA